MSSPDLDSLAEGLTRLKETYGHDDPVVKAIVEASAAFVTACTGSCCNHDVQAIRSLLD